MSSCPALQYHTLRSAGRQVCIELWPRPGAACLLFYPGTMFCPVQYRPFLHSLWKSGLAVAALHLTGHGRNPHHCLFSFADLLQDGLDAEEWLLQKGLGPVLLCGHSQGGILALAHASRSHRARACFAFSAIFPQHRHAIELTRFAALAGQRERLLAGTAWLARWLPWLPLPVFSYLSVKKILAGRLRLPLDRRQTRTSYPLRYLHSLFSADIATTLHCPFHLFNARDDALFTQALIEDTLAAVRAPEKHVVWLPHGGHLAILSPAVASPAAARVAALASGHGLPLFLQP
ncbi:alpha/beta fold hydrolase [uncultured Desulfovibrio sp.]|uniref:alpha/beta hydrolase n=1 Tax=uncultured Desulfovibrio sp. TaxID=167968 RepID=UPI0026109248|nr:alpha/beta fold hydrolase [uncultured Desulfovibrio sp.]